MANWDLSTCTSQDDITMISSACAVLFRRCPEMRVLMSRVIEGELASKILAYGLTSHHCHALFSQQDFKDDAGIVHCS